MAGVIGAASRADAGAFLSRLLRLDPAALVRLRPTADVTSTVTGSVTPPVTTGETDVDTHGSQIAGTEQSVTIWARLPFGVLVSRSLVADVRRDSTVRASELFAAVSDNSTLPTVRDKEWVWSIPTTFGEKIEAVPAVEIRRVAAAAANIARTAIGEGVAGRAVGSRRVRDALLDHVPIVIDTGYRRVDVPQRLVQAIVKMGFVGDDDGTPVVVRRAEGWTGLAAAFGTAWYRPVGGLLSLHVSPYRPKS